MEISFLRSIKVLILCLLLVLTACETDLDYNIRGYTQKIIVEGSIETGRHPVVYLSLNVPLWKTLDSASILEHVIRYAKVTISDGVNTEILTSKWEKTHFPPYSYNATDIVGVEGRNYQLKVEYGGYTVYSTTSIPVGNTIESVESIPTEIADTLKILRITMNVNASSSTAYKFYTKKTIDNRFIETPLVFNENLNLSGLQQFNLSPAPAKSDSSYKEKQYFAVGDTIDIKICAIDSVSTLFFKDLSIYSTIAANIFTSEIKPLKSNITEPGFGIWYGKGVRYFRYIVK